MCALQCGMLCTLMWVCNFVYTAVFVLLVLSFYFLLWSKQGAQKKMKRLKLSPVSTLWTNWRRARALARYSVKSYPVHEACHCNATTCSAGTTRAFETLPCHGERSIWSRNPHVLQYRRWFDLDSCFRMTGILSYGGWQNYDVSLKVHTNLDVWGFIDVVLGHFLPLKEKMNWQDKYLRGMSDGL